jgi:hypothetical protein
MYDFTAKEEEAFLNACAALGVEPKVMIDALKERYVASGFLKDPLVWLETELLDRTYRTRGETQEVANSIDRLINEGGNNGPVKQGWSTKAFKGDIGHSVRLEVDRSSRLTSISPRALLLKQWDGHWGENR